MTWYNIKNPCTNSINNNNNNTSENSKKPSCNNEGFISSPSKISNPPLYTICCPCCSHHIPLNDHQASDGFKDLPAGMKFDPTDPEILQHLESKLTSDFTKLHPLLDEFIPTIDVENGICYTHPENLPGVSKDGVMRHFFHHPSKAYKTGTRKRRKVHTNEYDGGEIRWHRTGTTRPILVNGEVKGFKKILVLYNYYGRQKKAEKTNWVLHQYHLGQNEEERNGEFVLSKVFYQQTQPRQRETNIKEPFEELLLIKTPPLNFLQLGYDRGVVNQAIITEINHLVPNMALQGDESQFI